MFERDETEEYRDYMIHRILELQPQEQYTKEELRKKSTSQLEHVFENIGRKGEYDNER